MTIFMASQSHKWYNIDAPAVRQIPRGAANLFRRSAMDSIPHASGIYQILCVPTGKIYIGSSRDLAIRKRHHLSRLRNGTHPNHHLQSAWTKYGQTAFVFGVVELVHVDALLAREQYWIDRLDACNRRKGYNLSVKAGAPMAGRTHRPETLAKMSEGSRIRQSSPEVRAKIGERSKAAQALPEVRAATSARSKQQAASPEYRKGMSARSTALQSSREYREKMSTSIKAARSTPEAHAKISAASTAAQATPEYRKAQSERVRAAQASPEYRAAQSARIKAAWARRKAKQNGD